MGQTLVPMRRRKYPDLTGMYIYMYIYVFGWLVGKYINGIGHNSRSLFFSFATVVLALKVILSQQGLDKPFTGGLGSFKLYVLVANHVSFFEW
jgi:hypothetical protein